MKNKVYYQIFQDSKAYQELTTLVVAKAINRYLEKGNIKQYMATILIDGLNKTQEKKISKSLRDLGIRTRKVKGIRDETNAIIRLADSLAGMIREVDNSNAKHKDFKKLVIKKDIFNELM